MHGMKWIRVGLFAPTTLSPSLFWVLLLVLAITYGPVVSVNAQGVGFISIDCGASAKNTSDNISWTTDSSYISLGRNGQSKIVALPPYDTLRYFPDTTINKYCYVFSTTANLSYLIRAGFLYGNYDNLFDSEGLPNFVLLFGANLWTNVTFNRVDEIVTHEMIALATSDTASVCVGRPSTTSHNPFISSLEIRPLSTSRMMYSPVHGDFLMKTNSRINFGEKDNASVRYPYDQYDRIWDSDNRVITGISTYNNITTTNVNVSVASSDDLPPSKVMQTARSPNKTENMSFAFTARFGAGQYYLAFYFAELDNSTQRVMDMYIDGHPSNQALNLSNLRGSYSTLELFYNYTVIDGSYVLLLMPNKNSTKAPIINAAESYFLQRMSQSTFDQDVQALEIIKMAFNLSAWMGDPCLPSIYKWSWLDCNNSISPARVIALNLSSMDLHNAIPSAIANLSALTSVDLHNNSLSGSVPVALASLRSLKFLDLSNNNLSGEYPNEFTNMTDVRITGNPFLCFNGSCDVASTAAPAHAPAPVTASGSRTSRGVLVGLLLAATFVLVVAVLGYLFLKRKSRKAKRLFVAHSAHWPPVPPFTEISKSVDRGFGVQNNGSNDVPVFSFADIQHITNNFENKIAAAEGSGTLFYGTLSDGQEVVVKLLHSNIKQTTMEFLYKVTPLSYVNHKNLLRPIGFCPESQHLMFVYEHVQKGSLYDYLHNKRLLDWKTRLSILQQVAQGLEHLHHVCMPSIVHGNLKSTNVLLSGDGLLAKVSNFGIYGLSLNVDATSGYLDPEYFAIHKLTEKSDVYSFGVLILEVVCGRMPFDTSLPKDAWNIVEWVRKVYHEGGHELIADASLHGNYNMLTLSAIVQLALQATESNANERPSMAELVVELKEANKIEVGHHVAFAELETSDYSNSSDAPLPSAYPNGVCEDEVCQ